MKRIALLVFVGLSTLWVLAACEDTRKLKKIGLGAATVEPDLKLAPAPLKLPAGVTELSFQAGFDGSYFITLKAFGFGVNSAHVLESTNGVDWQDTTSFHNLELNSDQALFQVGNQFYLFLLVEQPSGPAQKVFFRRIAQGQWVEDASAASIYANTIDPAANISTALKLVNPKVVGTAQDTTAPYYSSSQKFATIDGQQAKTLTNDATALGYKGFYPRSPLLANGKILVSGLLERKDGRRELGLLQGNSGLTQLSLIKTLGSQDQPAHYSYDRNFIAAGNGLYLVGAAPDFGPAAVGIDNAPRQGAVFYLSQDLNGWTRIKDATLDQLAKPFSLEVGQEFYQLVTLKFVHDRFFILADQKVLKQGSASQVIEDQYRYSCHVITSMDLKIFDRTVLDNVTCEFSRVLYGNGIYYLTAQEHDASATSGKTLNNIVLLAEAQH